MSFVNYIVDPGRPAQTSLRGTERSESPKSMRKKPVVYVSARSGPGKYISSWMDKIAKDDDDALEEERMSHKGQGPGEGITLG